MSVAGFAESVAFAGLTPDAVDVCRTGRDKCVIFVRSYYTCYPAVQIVLFKKV